MRLLVLDPRSGDSCADLYVIYTESRSMRRQRLGYVPEFRYDAAGRELLVVETDPGRRLWQREPRYWLDAYDPATLRRIRRRETPSRPMYAGFPNRSHRLSLSPSGRYVYMLESSMAWRQPVEDSGYRLTAWRYDRTRDVMEPGCFAVQSCMVAFGTVGEDEDELYFHLACDYPSTVATGRFGSGDVRMTQLEAVAPRHHCPQETRASWLAPDRRSLYCLTGEGVIHRMDCVSGGSRRWFRMPLDEGQSVPLHSLDGAGENLFIGISEDEGERSLSLSSEVWQVSLETAHVVRRLALPFSVINFVVSRNGEFLAGVSPYDRRAFVMEVGTGRVREDIEKLGISPAEIQFLDEPAA
jgi:hypothetical protein